MILKIGGSDIILELSPLIVEMSNHEHSDAKIDYEAYKKAINTLESFAKVSPNLQKVVNTLGKDLNVACMKRRYYISAKGELRFCPYEKSFQVNLLQKSRASIFTEMHTLTEVVIPKKLSCLSVCL